MFDGWAVWQGVCVAAVAFLVLMLGFGMGQPVYAVVMYVLEGETWSTLGRKVITSAGEYHESGTLEIRRKAGEVGRG